MSDDVLITPASRKIEFKDSDSNVDAVIETDTNGNLSISNAGGTLDIAGYATDAELTAVETTANAALPKAGGTMTGNLKLNDSVDIRMGTGNDFKLLHNGTNSKINNNTGALQISNFADNNDVTISTDDGSGGTAVYFRADGSTGDAILSHYGTEKLKTQSGGVDITGNITVSGTVDGKDVSTLIANVSEDTTPQLGGDLDANGHNINIDQGDDLNVGGLKFSTFSTYNTGVIRTDGITSNSLYITPDAGNNVYIRNGTNALFNYEQMAAFLANGAVSLNYDNNVKFETTSTGVLVSGDVKFGGSDSGVLDWKTSTVPGPFSGQFSEYIILQNKASSTEQELYLIDTGDGNDGDIFGIASNNAPVFAITGNSAIKLMHPNTASYDVNIEPTTPTANRTITLPDATGTAGVYKKTEFSLTPSATSVTIGTSENTTAHKYLLILDTLGTSSGPNNILLNIEDTASTPADISWAITTSVGSTNSTTSSTTDLFNGLGTYHQPSRFIIEVWRTDTTNNNWYVRAMAPYNQYGNYIIQGVSTGTVTGTIGGFTFGTGSSYNWTNVNGALWEYY